MYRGKLLTALVASCCACLLPLAAAVADHAHGDHVDLHKCDMCPCFVRYPDRDLWLPKKPYKVAKNPYETSLDSCLAACITDDDCKAVVHGITGGRRYLTCEYYDEVDPTGSPTYTPYMEVFIKRKSMPCMVDYDAFDEVVFEDDDALLSAAAERKERWQKVFARRNPLFWGRKRR